MGRNMMVRVLYRTKISEEYFLRAFIQTRSGDKLMTIKCEWIRKIHSQALDRPPDQYTTPLPALQTFYSHHDSQLKPDKKPIKHPDAASGKLHAMAQHLGCRAAEFTPWVPRVVGSDAEAGRRGVCNMDEAATQAPGEGGAVPSG